MRQPGVGYQQPENSYSMKSDKVKSGLDITPLIKTAGINETFSRVRLYRRPHVDPWLDLRGLQNETFDLYKAGLPLPVRLHDCLVSIYQSPHEVTRFVPDQVRSGLTKVVMFQE